MLLIKLRKRSIDENQAANQQSPFGSFLGIIKWRMEYILEFATNCLALILDDFSHQGHVEQMGIRLFRTVCRSALGDQPG